jgi:rfaE bifunctional protein nucleotidyltransferase chain/domain
MNRVRAAAPTAPRHDDEAPTAAPIVGLAEAKRRVAAARRAPDTERVVLANGLFDLMHVGHMRYLRAARRQGDMLVVAINDDRSARALRGPGRPLIPARDRARLVAAVRGVAMVLIFGGTTVTRVLWALRPDVHCKGTDYRPGNVPERAVVRAYGGAVRVVGDRKRHASTAIMNRMTARR